MSFQITSDKKAVCDLELQKYKFLFKKKIKNKKD